MIQPAIRNETRAPRVGDVPFIAADIGGTHARIGLVSTSARQEISLLTYRQYACADWPSLVAILKDFIAREAKTPISHCVLAIAGFAVDGRVINQNLVWPVSLHDLQQSLQLDDVTLVNDFAALAYAVKNVGSDAGAALTQVKSSSQAGPRVVVGPGTGLGSAVLIPHVPSPIVLATEAGQIAFAPRTPLEREILALLAGDGRHVSTETLLSGPGILTLYRSLSTIHGVEPVHTDPSGVTDAGHGEDDPVARQTLDVFCGVLGSFVGDLAMLYGAGGGMYLAGGVIVHIRDFLPRSSFVERFVDKGAMRAFLEQVPVYLLDHGRLGVLGAADWYLDRAA